MENLTPSQITVVIIGAVLALAGAVNTIGNAVEKAVKVWRAAKAPNIQQNERIDDLALKESNLEKSVEELQKKVGILERKTAELEAKAAELERFAAQDKKHLQALDEGNRVTLQALLALLDHGIDGNNVTQMEAAKADVQHHLINR